MTEEKVQYDKRQIVQVLRDLNQIVVSLDRIGFEYADLPDRRSDEELNAILAAFIFEWKVFEKLASARMVLDSAFSCESGKDEMDELEREFQDVEYWSMNKRTPSVGSAN